MATKRRRCKNGKLKRPVRTKTGGKRMCKKRKTKRRCNRFYSRSFSTSTLNNLDKNSLRRRRRKLVREIRWRRRGRSKRYYRRKTIYQLRSYVRDIDDILRTRSYRRSM